MYGFAEMGHHPSGGGQGTWWEAAACLRADPELFFTREGASRETNRTAELEAKQICAECVVRPQCLSIALARNEQYGIWGGLNPKERLAWLADSA
jgi:WhiB family redox-sensing transcriptional regulator